MAGIGLGCGRKRLGGTVGYLVVHPMSPEDLAKWKARGGQAPLVLGVHGPVVAEMNPRALEFKARAKAGQECNGCAFASQRAAICNMVGEQAALRRLPACDDGVIYLLVTKDERQTDLLTGE